MTHIFTDEEYQGYRHDLEALKELQEWKAHIEERAIDCAKNNSFVDTPCRGDTHNFVCDDCAIAWIFPDCPIGKVRRFSK
jgi:hypothetical protein